MKKKKLSPYLKVALASTIAVTSAAAIIYNTPEIVKTVAVESNESDKFILDVEKIDGDTVKVSLDNIEDIPKALQFSIKLDGVILKEENETPLIKDLVNKDNSENIITNYTYNKQDNIIDVLITSTKDLPKEGNKVDIFELDIQKDAQNDTKKYSITATSGSTYKYVSTTNKEYVRSVEIANNNLSINTSPTLKKKDNINYIEINANDTLPLTKEKLSEYIELYDADGDNITLEVRDRDNKVITEFVNDKEGIYDLYIIAKDGYDSSDTLNLQVKVNAKQENPIIKKNGEELKDIVIKSGEFDTIEELIKHLKSDVKAVDINGKEIDFNVEIDENISLNPEKTEVYLVTYKAADSENRETTKQIALTIRVNTAPVINGVKDHTLTVGDKFNPIEGVTVEDDYDEDIELKIYYNEDIELKIGEDLDTSKALECTLTYISEDSDGAITRAISNITINPKDKDDQENGNGDDQSKPGDGSGQGGNDDIIKPGDNTTIVVPDFIENIIDDEILSKVSGEATIENPLILDVKDVSVDEFNKFINKLKNLKPTLIRKYTEANYTVYKMKLENTQNIIQKIFRVAKLSEDGIVELRVVNTLENEEKFKDILDELLNTSLDTDKNESENQTDSSEDVIIEGEDTDSNNKQDGKLPITGQESVLGVIGILAVAIGGAIYKKKK